MPSFAYVHFWNMIICNKLYIDLNPECSFICYHNIFICLKKYTVKDPFGKCCVVSRLSQS